jgi:hypothetical protein
MACELLHPWQASTWRAKEEVMNLYEEYTQQDDYRLPEPCTLSAEELMELNREYAHFMHGWVRDVAASRVQRKRKGAIAMLEAFISSATGSPYPKVDDYVVSYHANFDRVRASNKHSQF